MKPGLRLLAIAVACMAAPHPLSAQTDSLQRYITDDFVAGFVAQPARLLNSGYVRSLIDAADKERQFGPAMEEVHRDIGFDPRQTDEIIMLLDKTTIFNMAGLPDDGGNAAAKNQRQELNERQQKNNLKQIALSLHNYHDIYSHFPNDDNAGEQNKPGKLSWRVHILPYLDEPGLYNEFRKDEDWDSDHNKALIRQMPAVFLTNGVKEKDRTSVHVLNSAGTLFGGDKAARIRDVTDGTSNTIMTVMAGVDKAEIWTKPGGLAVQPGAPTESLGNIGDTFLYGLADGSVRTMKSDDEKTFQAMATSRGGEVVDHPSRQPQHKPGRLPSWIVRSHTDIDPQAVYDAIKPMGDPVETRVGGQVIQVFGKYAIAFPDSKTLVAAPVELLPKMLNNAKVADSPFTKRLRTAAQEDDFRFVADLAPLTALKNQLAGNVPMAGIVQAIDVLQASFDLTGTSDSLQKMTSEMQNETSATQLSGLLTGLLQMQKAQLMNIQAAPLSPYDPEAMKILADLVGRTEIKVEGSSVVYRIPKPTDIDGFLKEIRPVVTQLISSITGARRAAQRSMRRNNLKQIGLAFHNYHSVYRAFPRYNSDADQRQKNLSWRVQLLPFLEHGDLYERFNLDEPWDSANNKKLIAEMPDIFNVEGVKKPGHTSMHVFIGKGTPFGDGTQKTRLRDFLDGTSNTILAVEAGPDTADVWTKPAGLEFTGNNGLKVLGNIAGEFLVLLSDGSVRTISNSIDEKTLHNLIQHQDRNVVGEF